MHISHAWFYKTEVWAPSCSNICFLGIGNFAVHQITTNKTTAFTEYQLSPHLTPRPLACAELQALTLQACAPTTEGLLGTQSLGQTTWDTFCSNWVTSNFSTPIKWKQESPPCGCALEDEICTKVSAGSTACSGVNWLLWCEDSNLHWG